MALPMPVQYLIYPSRARHWRIIYYEHLNLLAPKVLFLEPYHTRAITIDAYSLFPPGSTSSPTSEGHCQFDRVPLCTRKKEEQATIPLLPLVSRTSVTHYHN